MSGRLYKAAKLTTIVSSSLTTVSSSVDVNNVGSAISLISSSISGTINQLSSSVSSSIWNLPSGDSTSSLSSSVSGTIAQISSSISSSIWSLPSGDSTSSLSSSVSGTIAQLSSSVSSSIWNLVYNYSTKAISGASGSSVTNTADETTLATYTIPGGSLVNGAIYNIRAQVYLPNVTESNSYTGRARLGGITGTVLALMVNGGPITGDSNYLDMNIYGTTTAGASKFVAASGISVAGVNIGIASNGGLATFPTNENLDVVVTGQWNAANASEAYCETMVVTKIT